MSGPDREDLEHEEAVAGLLRRRPRSVDIPPFTAVEARLVRRTPMPLVVLLATALVVVALIAGGLLAERRSRVAEPQPTPQTSASSGSPDAAALSDRLGFMWAPRPGAPGVAVRTETYQDGFELSTQAYRFSACSCAVSPDGNRIAYWAGATPGTIELRVVDVARNGSALTIYKPSAGQRGTALAWSSDGSGILFSIEDWGTPGGPVGGPSGTSLLVIEAAGGNATTLATGDGVYVPLGWDRAAGIAAAGLSGEGGFMTGYLTVRTSGDPAPKRTAMPDQILMGSVRVAADQRFVLGVFSSGQGDTVRWWKLADPGAMVTGPRLARNVQPSWRPQSSQIGWVDAGTLRLLDVERGVTSSGGSLPPGNDGAVVFRVDGSAAATARGSSYVLLDIASGRTAALRSAGDLIASVRFTVASTPSSPTSTPVPQSPSSTPSATLPQTGNAEYFFQPGAMRWCGTFGSYRAPSTVASGELKIGSVTFLPTAIGFGAPYTQRIASDVRPGGWVCLIATVIPSDTAANQLTDLSVESAPTGSMPPGPIRATPCGIVSDFDVSDLPSGGWVSLNGTKFVVGGLRAASDVVQLPPPGDLRIGARVCIVGTSLTPLDAGTFRPAGGRVMLDR